MDRAFIGGGIPSNSFMPLRFQVLWHLEPTGTAPVSGGASKTCPKRGITRSLSAKALKEVFAESEGGEEKLSNCKFWVFHNLNVTCDKKPSM